MTDNGTSVAKSFFFGLIIIAIVVAAAILTRDKISMDHEFRMAELGYVQIEAPSGGVIWAVASTDEDG